MGRFLARSLRIASGRSRVSLSQKQRCVESVCSRKNFTTLFLARSRVRPGPTAWWTPTRTPACARVVMLARREAVNRASTCANRPSSSRSGIPIRTDLLLEVDSNFQFPTLQFNGRIRRGFTWCRWRQRRSRTVPERCHPLNLRLVCRCQSCCRTCT